MSKKRTPAAKSAQPSTAILTELREEVKRVIQTATGSAYPSVEARLANVEGYKQVEEAIIGVVLRNHITPGTALALLESEWGGI